MEKYKESLKEAITGEFNAILKYKKYSEIAEKENFPNIAYLFKALAAGEQIHFDNHKRALKEAFEPESKDFSPGTTLENLKDALGGETWEFKDMYPQLMKSIKRDGSTEGLVAKLSMEWAKETEKTHAEVLQHAIGLMEAGNDFQGDKLWVCDACGNLYVGEKPNELCPVCKHDPFHYKEVPR
ncbi:MAG: rubrerythrin family protein [Candidatus Hodarchaeota archaeon]